MKSPVQPAAGRAEPRLGDAFGMALAACHAEAGRPGREFHVIERDDALVWAVDTAHYFAAPEDWPALDRMACAEARGRVLDVGCGAGRHSLFLSAQGHDVVGLDSSPGAVAVAAARGVPAVQGSVVSPPAGLGRFETLLLLCNGVALLGSPHDAPAVLEALAGLAAPDARLLVGSTDLSRSVDATFKTYGEENIRNGRPYGQARLRVRYDMVATEWFDALNCGPDELATLLRGTPWSVSSVLPDGIEYVAVLRRS